MSAVQEAASLFGYPTQVQAELARIATQAQRMTDGEIADALAAFVGVAEVFVASAHAPQTVALLDAVGRLLQASHHARKEQ